MQCCKYCNLSCVSLRKRGFNDGFLVFPYHTAGLSITVTIDIFPSIAFRLARTTNKVTFSFSSCNFSCIFLWN